MNDDDDDDDDPVRIQSKGCRKKISTATEKHKKISKETQLLAQNHKRYKLTKLPVPYTHK